MHGLSLNVLWSNEHFFFQMEPQDRSCWSYIRCICFPLAIGNPVMHRNRPTNSDGKISSSVLVTCLIPILFVMMFVLSITPSVRNPNPLSWGLVEIWLAFGFLSSISLSIRAYRRRAQYMFGLRAPELSQNPKLLFLWIFGFGVIVHSGLNMSINIDCIIKGGREPFPGEQLLSVFSHFGEIAFHVAQLGFISYFVNYRFISSVLLSYSMSVMLITHLVVWFYSIISSLRRSDILHPQNISLLNQTNCFWGSDINALRSKLAPYLSPVQLEYSLLSAAFLLKIWSVVDKEEDTTSYREPEYHTSQPETDEETPLMLAHHSLPANFRSGGNSLSDQITAKNIQSNHSVVFGIQQAVRRFREIQPVSFYMIVLFSFLVITPVVVALMILISVRKTNLRMHFIWEIIRTIFTCIHLAFLVLAFRCLKKRCFLPQNPSRMEKRGIQYILLMSSAGAVAYSTFSIVSGMMCKCDKNITHPLAIVITIEYIVNIVAIYLQTVLIMYGSTFKGITRTQRTSSGDGSVFVFLMVTNFVSWFNNSFISNHLEKGSIQHEFYSGVYWKIINETIFPFVIFYRFHSSMDMYELFRKYQ